VARQRVYLRNVGDVMTELCRQYRAAVRGAVEWQDAVAASRILRELRQIMESADIEQRLAQLESTIVDIKKTNGHGHQPSL
jgi:hypothetical protein